MSPSGTRLRTTGLTYQQVFSYVKSLLLNQLMAALADGGSSYVTVHSPFGTPVILSMYR